MIFLQKTLYTYAKLIPHSRYFDLIFVFCPGCICTSTSGQWVFWLPANNRARLGIHETVRTLVCCYLLQYLTYAPSMEELQLTMSILMGSGLNNTQTCRVHFNCIHKKSFSMICKHCFSCSLTSSAQRPHRSLFSPLGRGGRPFFKGVFINSK